MRAFEGDSCIFEVLSNVEWNVSIGEQAEGMDVSFEKETRNGGGSVKVTLAEHFNLDSPVYADLIFTAKDCDTISMRLTQVKAVPYVRINEVSRGEEIIPSIGGTRTMLVKSNVDWTIGLKEDAADNVKFSKSTGGRGETSVLITFEGTPSFDARRELTVSLIQLAGEDDGRNLWTFTQERGSLLRFVFLYNGKWYWPFYCKDGTWPKISSSIDKPESQGEEKIFETYAGYTLKLFSNHGYVFGNQGIRFGRSTSFLGDYIELPVIEGRSLVKINWTPDEQRQYSSLTATVKKAGSLTNPNVGVPEEGDYQDGVRTWLLEGEKSQAYWFVPTQNATYSVEILECIYK